MDLKSNSIKDGISLFELYGDEVAQKKLGLDLSISIHVQDAPIGIAIPVVDMEFSINRQPPRFYSILGGNRDYAMQQGGYAGTGIVTLVPSPEAYNLMMYSWHSDRYIEIRLTNNLGEGSETMLAKIETVQYSRNPDVLKVAFRISRYETQGVEAFFDEVRYDQYLGQR